MTIKGLLIYDDERVKAWGEARGRKGQLMTAPEFYKCVYCDTTTETEALFAGIDFGLKRICVCEQHKNEVGLLLDAKGDWQPITMPKGAIVGKAGKV